jgi:hypothetical protein
MMLFARNGFLTDRFFARGLPIEFLEGALNHLRRLGIGPATVATAWRTRASRIDRITASLPAWQLAVGPERKALLIQTQGWLISGPFFLKRAMNSVVPGRDAVPGRDLRRTQWTPTMGTPNPYADYGRYTLVWRPVGLQAADLGIRSYRDLISPFLD